ncbi:ketoacyl-ACP synthase III [Paenibacillus thermoaerophilus]|uniref:Beta-ketoacyl-[acyl-carrier-protein] synthase III n=1 Tax=Paenibacillus thermoaerophilus TaxID=1215385 RepID=A0ABW2V5Q8_9BACL|nr:ketoacyl-ACP synthase III [Paenibacillus thermoaerophilus]TMV17705.1 ketoacyl-ACP synthase III [Paenibacillus thermoaerophilus]
MIETPAPFVSRSRITAIGGYVPERTLTNFDLEKMVDTSDEWIVRRTGIRERRIAAENQLTSDLCVAAIRNLAERHQADLSDVDLLLVATITPDHATPSTACQVQAKLSLPVRMAAFDLNAACGGFVYALHVANGLITAGLHRKALVVGAEKLSSITNDEDRTTCVLFGDGAGAVLLEACEPEQASFAGPTLLETEGKRGASLYCTNHPEAFADSGRAETEDGSRKSGFIVQNGREVYKWAATRVPAGIARLLEQHRLTAGDIDWFVPHSANARMIESIAESAGLPLDRTLTSLEKFGNTSAASIPLALWQAEEAGRLRDGDRLLLYGFGGGLVQAAMIVRCGFARSHPSP